MSRKKIICFLIFAVGKANGGHYRSLSTISEALSNDYDVLIINVGYTHSKIIKNSSVKSKFVYFNGLDFLSTVLKIKKLLNRINVDYFHCFDYQSFFIGRLLSNKFKKPVLYTKCGGPSPKGYFPDIFNLTVFSNENFNFFKGKKKYKDSNIWLIPNRVTKFETDNKKVNQLKEKYNLKQKIIFLRICRINEFYKKSILQSINLVNTLKENGYDVALIILGNLQDPQVLSEISHFTNNSNTINIEIDDYFTLNAKEIIDVSKFVIGTGRGFMEASSCAKVMLTPSIVGKYPVLINEDNFGIAFDKNFSERIEFTQPTIDNNLNKIINLLSDENSLNIESIKSFDRYQMYFSIDEGVESYRQVYENIVFKKNNLNSLFCHWVFVIRNNLGTWFRILK